MPSKQRETTSHDVTLTAPDGRTAKFGPMPARDAALVTLAAAAAGHGATVTTR